MSLSGIFPIDRWSFTTQSTLSALTEEDYADLVAHQSEQKYCKGDVIFREGSVPSGIFMIRSRKVKKYKVDNNAKEQIIYVAGPGELIGYHAVLSEERYLIYFLKRYSPSHHLPHSVPPNCGRKNKC